MIITQTPLRISFAGGGTDLPEYFRAHGGRVVNCAIDKYVYVIVKRRYDEAIYINYSKKEIVQAVDEIRHELVREALRIAGIDGGVEITTLADIPSEGSGLGSSSSVTVGLLNAFHLFQGNQMTAETLARQACIIELERLKKPMGWQDAYIAAYGGLREFCFGPGDAVTTEAIELSREARLDLQRRLMMFFTGITREATPILKEQREAIGARRTELGTLKELAENLAGALRQGRIAALGENLRQGWEAKRKLAQGISSSTLEGMIEAALRAGAEGAKICGAGGGGFVLVVCPPERQRAVRAALAAYRELPVRIARAGSRAVFNIHEEPWG